MMPTTIQAVAVVRLRVGQRRRALYVRNAAGRFSSGSTPRPARVAWCSQRTVGLACEAAPEDRAVLEGEIARLTAENAALKKAILAHGFAAAVRAPLLRNRLRSRQRRTTASRCQLPSDADIDRMVAYTGRLWHRFMDFSPSSAGRDAGVLNKS